MGDIRKFGLARFSVNRGSNKQDSTVVVIYIVHKATDLAISTSHKAKLDNVD